MTTHRSLLSTSEQPKSERSRPSRGSGRKARSLALLATTAFILSGCALGLDFDALEYQGEAEDGGLDADATVSPDADGGTTTDTDTDTTEDGGDSGEADAPDADGGLDAADGSDIVDQDACTPSQEVCDGVDNDCDGLIDDEDGDVDLEGACGSCDTFCEETLNATATCEADECVIQECDAGFVDANSRFSDGCEFGVVPRGTFLGGLDLLGVEAFDLRTSVVITTNRLVLYEVVSGDEVTQLDFVELETEGAITTWALRDDDIFLGTSDNRLHRYRRSAEDTLELVRSSTIPRSPYRMAASDDALIVGYEDGAVQRFATGDGAFRLVGSSSPFTGDVGVEYMAIYPAGDSGMMVSTDGQVVGFSTTVVDTDAITVIGTGTIPADLTTVSEFAVVIEPEPPTGAARGLYILGNNGTVDLLVAFRLETDSVVQAWMTNLGSQGHHALSFSRATGFVLLANERGNIRLIDVNMTSDPLLDGPVTVSMENASTLVDSFALTPDTFTTLTDSEFRVYDRVGVIGQLSSAYPLGAEFHDISASSDVAYIAIGDGGVWPIELTDAGPVPGVPVRLTFDIRRVTASASLIVAMDVDGRLFLLRRLADGSLNIEDNAAFSAGTSDTYRDVYLSAETLLIPSGDAGIRVINIRREPAPEQWLLGTESARLLARNGFGASLELEYNDVVARDGYAITAAGGSVYAFNISAPTTDQLELVLRNSEDIPIATNIRSVVAHAPNKIMIMDPSLGFVGFTFGAEDDPPFTIRSGFYVLAVEGLASESDNWLAGDGTYFSRLSPGRGFSLIYNGTPSLFGNPYPAYPPEEGEPAPPPGYVTTTCPGRRHTLSAGHVVAVHDCGVDIVQYLHE